MFKYLGQHIFDFVSKFRNDVYFKNLTGSSDTTALVVDADGKVHTNSLGSSGDTEATKVRLPVRFQEAVVKGDPVYISGYNNGQDRAEVAKADCDDAAKMPAFGLADAAYSANDNGFVISIGNLGDVDTQAYSVGDTLYVASGGGLTNVKPTTEARLIQNVGVVTRSQQNSGQIEVVATGRSNDVPNLNNDSIFIGNSNNKAEAQALSAVLASYLSPKEDVSNKSTDVTMGGVSPSSTLYTTEYAVSTYVQNEIAQAQSGIPTFEIDMFANYKVHETDEDGTTTFVGKIKATNGNWLVEKFVDNSGDITATYANESNNSSYTTLATAWTNRSTLTYTTIDNLTSI